MSRSFNHNSVAGEGLQQPRGAEVTLAVPEQVAQQSSSTLSDRDLTFDLHEDGSSLGQRRSWRRELGEAPFVTRADFSDEQEFQAAIAQCYDSPEDPIAALQMAEGQIDFLLSQASCDLWQVAKCYAECARAYVELGCFAEARTSLWDALDCVDEKQPNTHLGLAEFHADLAICEFLLHQEDWALDLMERAQRMYQAVSSIPVPDLTERCRALSQFGQLWICEHAASDRESIGVEFLRAANEIAEVSLPKDCKVAVCARREYGEVLCQQEDPDAGFTLLYRLKSDLLGLGTQGQQAALLVGQSIMQAYLDAGDPVGALGEADRVLASLSKTESEADCGFLGEIYLAKAHAHSELNQSAQAKQAYILAEVQFEQAGEPFAVQRINALDALVDNALEVGDEDEAIAWKVKAIEAASACLVPDDSRIVELRSSLVHLYIAQEQFQLADSAAQAIQDVYHQVGLVASREMVELLLTRAQIALGQKEIESELAYLKKAFDLAGKLPEAEIPITRVKVYMAQAGAHLRAGDIEPARAACDFAVNLAELQDQNEQDGLLVLAEALSNRAALFLLIDEFSPALGDLTRVIELQKLRFGSVSSPELAEAYFGAAEAQLRLNKNTEAENFFRQAWRQYEECGLGDVEQATLAQEGRAYAMFQIAPKRAVSLIVNAVNQRNLKGWGPGQFSLELLESVVGYLESSADTDQQTLNSLRGALDRAREEGQGFED